MEKKTKKMKSYAADLNFEKNVNLHFATILQDLRKKSGMKQDQVADLLAVNRSTYSYYELGRTEPRLSQLIRLSRLFSVSVDYLLGEEKRLALPDEPPPYSVGDGQWLVYLPVRKVGDSYYLLLSRHLCNLYGVGETIGYVCRHGILFLYAQGSALNSCDGTKKLAEQSLFPLNDIWNDMDEKNACFFRKAYCQVLYSRSIVVCTPCWRMGEKSVLLP